MLRQQNNLDRRILPNHCRIVDRQRYMRQTYRSRVNRIRGPRDPEDGLHDHREVFGQGAVAQVDVEQGFGVAVEPAGL